MIDRAVLVDVMLAAAREAAAAILVIRARGLDVERKDDGSPVTAADRAAEAIILACLARAVPELPVISEENAASHCRAPPAEFLLVDPIDGTKEFIAGRDEFTVNIALVEHGYPRLGVVLAPATGHVYWTDALGAAWMQRGTGRRAIQARVGPASGLIAAVSRSHMNADTRAFLATQLVQSELVCGSSLKFCLVACGEADISPRFGPTNEWDTAAGDAVLRAAGGRMQTIDGAVFAYGKPGFRNGNYVALGAADLRNR